MINRLAPYMIAAYIPLFIYMSNINELGFNNFAFFVTLTIVEIAVFFLNNGIYIFIKDREKVNIITIVWLVFFYSAEGLKIVAEKLIARNFINDFMIKIGVLNLLFCITLCIVIVLSICIIRTKKELIIINKVILVISITLIFIVIFSYTPQLTKNIKRLDNINRLKTSQLIKDKIKNNPDIYYIILDGHTSIKTLATDYNYKSDFEEKLKVRGFDVLSNAKSNYPCTIFSIPSSLNMEYINNYNLKNGNDLTYYYKLMSYNEVMKKMKEYGYTVKSINNTGWNIPLKYSDLDISNSRASLNYFSEFLNKTILFIFTDRITINFHRNPNLNTLKFLKENSTMEEINKFVFAHILLPHHPFVFDKNGNIPKLKDSKNVKSGYIDQTHFIDKEITKIIDEILLKHNKNVIIILQADHGVPYVNDKHWFDILNAVYSPGGKIKFYSGMTPVNTFRLIFNSYFNEKNELIKDESYYSDYQNPYMFKKIWFEE